MKTTRLFLSSIFGFSLLTFTPKSKAIDWNNTRKVIGGSILASFGCFIFDELIKDRNYSANTIICTYISINIVGLALTIWGIKGLIQK